MITEEMIKDESNKSLLTMWIQANLGEEFTKYVKDDGNGTFSFTVKISRNNSTLNFE